MLSHQAVVFPGQGSQRLEMAMDFCDRYPIARAVFESANAALGFDLMAICQEDLEQLNLTACAQPAIVTAEIAMWSVLTTEYGLSPSCFAGHSLGEYTALVAAGVIPFDIAVQLVRRRGELMQSAAAPGFGVMAACIMKDLPDQEFKTIANGHGVDLANDNSNKQVVISGEAGPTEAVIAELEGRFGKALRVVRLNVSAPFHSRHMASLSDSFRDVLQAHAAQYDVSGLGRVLSNYTGEYYVPTGEALIDSLVFQLDHTVRWRDNMAHILNKTDAVIEVGPGRPLSGFFLSAGQKIDAITDCKTLDKCLQGKRI